MDADTVGPRASVERRLDHIHCILHTCTHACLHTHADDGDEDAHEDEDDDDGGEDGCSEIMLSYANLSFFETPPFTMRGCVCK